MIYLPKRLLACANFVTPKGRCVDVGTDHGKLPTYLILNNLSNSAIACDINEMPLNSAKKTIMDNFLSDKIDIILSDGLDNVSDENVTDVVMAGMGGELILDITSRCEWLKRGVNLILQPMTKAHNLRIGLRKAGFEIIKEKAVCEDNFIYVIINAKFTGKIQSTDTEFAYFGKVDIEDIDGKAYFKLQENRLRLAGLGKLKSNPNDENAKEMIELANKVLNKLDINN